MNPFAVSIFLSAFLLFQIQPMMGKLVLPWFGGTTSVWTTVMLFFQVLLTLGYAYANWLSQHLPPVRQKVLHVSLLAIAVLVLAGLATTWASPITPGPEWKPRDVASPAFDIFVLLLAAVGLPYFILAANGPLMQAWYSRAHPRQPYARLYSLSNLGSLSGLLTYPVVVEPAMPLRWQGWAWSAGFLAFAGIAAWIGTRARWASPLPAAGADRAPAGTIASPASTGLILALSATPSLFLLAVTNRISQDVAVVPFLWVAPLTVYLLSLILTFSGERAYARRVFAAMFTALTVLAFVLAAAPGALPVEWQIVMYCLLLFAVCMICHGELYRLRPAASRLTSFYLLVAIGGALGGIFVSLVAPAIFDGYWEFFIGLAMTIAIMLIVLQRHGSLPAPGGAGDEQAVRAGLTREARTVLAVFAIATLTPVVFSQSFHASAFARRNFYGIVRVAEIRTSESDVTAFAMANGIITHGLQFVSPDRRGTPTAYYTRDSGAALAIVNHPKYGKGMRVGLLGLGIGTLVAYGRPGDEYHLYEINPVVVELAQGQGNYFSFLRDSQARTVTVIGDARLSLERELAAGRARDFDVLVLDTFSSDSIPVHMVTKEAFALYLQRLAPGGIIAAHITNHYLDLQPVLWQLAKHHGLQISRLDYPGDDNGGYAAQWVLLARDRAVLDDPALASRATSLAGYSTGLDLWTDDYSNLFQILK